MELTRKALEDVKFRARGRWYNAEQVDAFLEELTVAVDETERELREFRQEEQARSRELESLREETARLQRECASLRKRAETVPAPDPAGSRRRVCEELERERDSLIQDIKALRRFRETFRQAVEKDAGDLLERAGSLGSEKLL